MKGIFTDNCALMLDLRYFFEHKKKSYILLDSMKAWNHLV